MSSRSYLIIFTIILISSSTIYAMPPRPGLKFSAVDEETRAQLGIDIVKNPVRDIGKRGIYNTPGDVQPLVSGTKKFPVVCIKYPDYANNYPIASFDSMLFSDNWSSGSAKKYYNDVSYGIFTLQGSVSGWYTSDNNKAYYGYSNGDARASALAKEAATKADASIDYSLYDNDHDGYVDVFTCLHAGYGMEETGNGADIWSHSWSFSSAGIGVYTTNDPDPVNGGYIKIDDYVIDPERSSYTNKGTMVCIGVFCHEWGHALGLPDLYDTSPTGAGEGLGDWCLMAAGSWGGDDNSPWKPVQMCAWAKMDLGWLNPTAVRSRGLYSIPYVETNSKAYWLIGRQRTFKEYFLVENRRKVLTDTFLYNPGLLIYHIDDSVIARQRSNNRVNAKMSGAWKYGVALEQADGLDELYSGGNRGDANDPWPGGLGKTLFDSTSTTPNTRTNYPTTNLVTSSFVKNIPAASPTMSCTLASGAVGKFTGGPDASGYKWIDSDTVGGPTYSWIDISQTGTALGTGDDARYWFRLPYNFKFYGTNYDTVWVCTNGWLSFGSNPGSSGWINASVPSGAVPNRAVFAFWDDLNVVASDGANMYYEVKGSAPNRYCVITWKDVERRASTYSFNQLTFQAILYENGKITLQYKDCAVGDTTYNWGRSASVGIENSTGSVGLQYLYNGSPIGNLLASERAIQFYPPSKDFEVTVIENPTGSIDSTNTTITPRARIRNNGATIDTCTVTFIIGSIYTDTRLKTLSAGAEDTVNFIAWQPVRGVYQTRCSTYLVNDVVSSNDTLSGSFTVNVHDVGIADIIRPTGILDTNISITPQAKVMNYGNNPETFNVRFSISGPAKENWSDDTTVTINSTDSLTINFMPWSIGARGIYATRCSTYLASDMVLSNNVLADSFTVQVKDYAATLVSEPYNPVDSGSVTYPKTIIHNFGSTNESNIPVLLYIVSTSYVDTQYVSLVAGDSIEITFDGFTANVARGNYTIRCTTQLDGDAVAENNLATREFAIRVADVGVIEIIQPVNTIDSTGTAVIPKVKVKNFGTHPENFNVKFTINGTAWSSTKDVSDLDAGTEQVVEFDPWTIGPRGDYTVKCSTELADDMYPVNDTLGNSFTVIVDTIPPVPTPLISPNGSIYDNTPEFIWHDVIDVDSFNLVIIGPTKELIDIVTAETTYTLPVPLADSSYIWKVRGKDVSGNWSVYSDSFTFTILAPVIPTLVSPNDSSIANNQTPTFIWNLSADADSFNLVYTGLAKLVTSITTKDTFYVPSTPLDSGSYFWKVRAKDEYGNYSGFSTEWTFTIDITPPSVPMLISPENNTILITESLTMVWHASNEAVLYNLVVGSDSIFLADTVFTTQLPRGIYLWKVRSQDTVENWSQFSLPWSFTIQIPAWAQQESMPTCVAGKYVKNGGALVAVNSSKAAEFFAFRGNKSKEFYKFNGIWTPMETMPYGVKPLDPTKINKKQIGKGAAMCYDGVNTIYATKGNNTREFWAYTISNSTWHAKAFVPVPKYLRGGTSIVYYRSRVYLLAGGQKKTDVNNFFVYIPGADTNGGEPWITARSLELGPNTKVWKDGVSIVELGGTIYALKSYDKFNFFFAYNIEGNTWTQKESLPVRDFGYGKLRKIFVKDGGATTSGQGAIYAIKGGGYNVFWKYTPIIGWTALETIPRLHKKSVPRTGAALVFAGDGKIYLLKGNNSSELWKFNPPAEKSNIKNQISNSTEQILQELNASNFTPNTKVEVTPNPINKNSVIKFNLTQSGGVEISLYNSVGQIQSILIDREFSGGSYSIPLNRLSLIKGIYFVKVKVGDSVNTIKLIVE